MSGISTILLVDDDEKFLELLVQCFTRRGMFAIGAGGLPEAFQVASARHFDVAIIERKLRGYDGLQLMARLKTMNSRLRVIVLSGCCDDSAVANALDQGGVRIPDEAMRFGRSERSRQPTLEYTPTRRQGALASPRENCRHTLPRPVPSRSDACYIGEPLLQAAIEIARDASRLIRFAKQIEKAVLVLFEHAQAVQLAL
jgi:DNA-binding NtrC family response regulator